MVVVPIVVSVPKCIKCLVVGDISVALEAVGLLEVEKLEVLVDALFAVGVVALPFQVKVLPFAIVGVVALHLVALHQFGSNNPTGIDVKSEGDTIPFHPYYTVKDYTNKNYTDKVINKTLWVKC